MVVLKLKTQSKDHVLGIVKDLMPHFIEHNPSRTLWIVDEEIIRIRT
jgi:hypothetical protein